MSIAILALAFAAMPAGAHTKNHTKKKLPDTSIEQPSKDPLKLIVSLRDQRVDVYRGAELITTSRVSTGQKGYGTPSGVFSILQKKRWHRSNIYSQAPMPYMQRLTWSGIALHAGYVPNRPASHGCIRLPAKFAPKLFRMTDVGAHVIIVHDEATPTPIEHPALFQPLAPVASSAAAPGAAASANPAVSDASVFEPPAVLRLAKAEASDASTPDSATAALAPADADPAPIQVKRSDSPLRILVTRRTGRERLMDVQRLLKLLGYEPGDIDGYMGPDTARAIQDFQRVHNQVASGLFSKELLQDLNNAAGLGEVIDGHIYVRQDFKPVFDAPLPLRGGDEPLGTHMFTAMHFEPGDTHVQWLALTIEGEAATAGDALDRIAIPDHVRELIAPLLTPGSSLIVSDHGLSKETFPKATDFVVLTD